MPKTSVMPKVIVVIFLLLLSFLPHFVEEPPKESYSLTELAKEPPISQKDIDILLEITPLSLNVDMTDLKAASDFVSSRGLTYRRYRYLKRKMPSAMALAEDEGAQTTCPIFIPPQMCVSPEEEAVVRNNFDKLQAAEGNFEFQAHSQAQDYRNDGNGKLP